MLLSKLTTGACLMFGAAAVLAAPGSVFASSRAADVM